MKTLVIPKSRFKETKYSLFEWMQCLDSCLYHTVVRNNIVENLHDPGGDMTVAAFVFDARDEPMGFAYAEVRRDQMCIRYISCKEKLKGYGSALLRALESFARSRGLRHVELISTSGSKQFYVKHHYAFGSMNSFCRRSLRLARNNDPFKLIPFVKYFKY
jgi:hypothetical protein